ncbi:class I adenylate-forming enzyme family protein [Nocardia huaxiensis]|uniref:Acyl--CoA ligase n=1 Tax=Nocardia huaxiensis TaxID=2755382 RepID=A0A7D6V7K4_9NOCA|nr:class I adenylate-forming enzyme family protein [Nocardia huaxiensis]QLY29581.1 acyl--CoA ligase [Nocardia huaxiensis]UFS96851.1 acyl--CoA ligase [Nocardia huaxiensis]
MGRFRDQLFEPGTMVQRAAERKPGVEVMLDKPFAIQPDLGTSFTVADLAGVVESFAGRLYALGVRPGERVVVYKTNNADIVAIALAVARIGAVPALLHPSLTGDTVNALLDMLRPRVVLTDADKLTVQRWEPAGFATGEVRVLLAAGRVSGLTTVGDVLPVPVPQPEFTDPSAVRIITHTSGTTGLPKLVAQTAAGLAAHIGFQHRVTKLRARIPLRWAMCTSFVHIRTYSALGTVLRRGWPFAMLADHDVDTAREVFLRFKPHLVETHPNQFIEWEQFATDPARPLRQVRFFVNTFDAIHLRTVRRLMAATDRRFVVYFQGYGQTESGPVTIKFYTRSVARWAHDRCVGYPLVGRTRFRTDGTPQRPGRIEVSTRGRALTYLGQEQRFADQCDGDWWDMGDVGYRSRWGCLHLLDREVDRIDGLASGLLVEDALMDRLPQLREVIVVRGGAEILQPLVCTKSDAPLDMPAWQAATADLPAMHAPLHVRWADLPVTATAKVRRIELQRMLAQNTLPILAGSPFLVHEEI